MRELNIMEVESVSGAGLFSRLGGAALGAIAGMNVGLSKGGVSGGSAGGILGLGVLSGCVTMVIGGITGVVTGGVYGFVNDWDKALASFNHSTEQWFDQTVSAPKV